LVGLLVKVVVKKRPKKLKQVEVGEGKEEMLEKKK
jgi:hypothetical protein